LPHDRVTNLAVGHLPCKYVKLECLRGAPVSLAKLEALGVPLKALQTRSGQPGLAPLLFEGAKDVLFRRSSPGAAKKTNAAAPSAAHVAHAKAAPAVCRVFPPDALLPPEPLPRETIAAAQPPPPPHPVLELRWAQAGGSSSSEASDDEDDDEDGNGVEALSPDRFAESDLARDEFEGFAPVLGNTEKVRGGGVADEGGEGDASWSDLLHGTSN